MRPTRCKPAQPIAFNPNFRFRQRHHDVHRYATVFGHHFLFQWDPHVQQRARDVFLKARYVAVEVHEPLPLLLSFREQGVHLVEEVMEGGGPGAADVSSQVLRAGPEVGLRGVERKCRVGVLGARGESGGERRRVRGAR